MPSKHGPWPRQGKDILGFKMFTAKGERKKGMNSMSYTFLL